MKKVEKVLLTLCYLFTIGASIKLYTKLLMDTPEFTFSAVVDLVFVGFLLSFLSVMAFVLLFTKRPND
jgi:hypothetical protein